MAQLAAVRRRRSTLLYFAAVLTLPLLLLLFRLKPTDTNLTPASLNFIPQHCNFTSSGGVWIRSRDPVIPRYSPVCKEIFKGWSCAAKVNRDDISRWIWKPNGCKDPILRFDPIRFLNRFRDRNIGFVGDSLNRNMFASMVCMLRHGAEGGVRKWRPAGADRGFTFEKYNLTVAYHRTNLLASYGSTLGPVWIPTLPAVYLKNSRWSANANGGDLESLGYKRGYRVDVDVPDRTWAEAPGFHDILIFNTGHWWWAPSKFDPVESPMLFFENGLPVLPPVPPEDGLDMTLKHVVTYINKNTKTSSIKFFRTQSPRHFEGGDWNQGGSCRRVHPLSFDEVEELFSSEKNGTNAEARLVNRRLYRALRGSSFRILDITRMSEFRADAHPSSAGGKKHEDCMHWCLPGLTDTWNDLLAAHLEHV